jgi:hypothetical protein
MSVHMMSCQSFSSRNTRGVTNGLSSHLHKVLILLVVGFKESGFEIIVTLMEFL